MAIQATFTADVTAFRANLDKAATSLTGLQRSTTQVNADLKKFGNEFSGQNLIRRAETMAKAIADVGGAAKLSERHLKEANATVSEAIAHYRRLGETAPASLRSLNAELAKVTSSTAGMGASLKSGLGAIASGLGVGLGAGLGLGALTALGSTIKELASDAARLSPLTQSFERLQGGSVQAERSILALRVATKGLVSDADLLQASNKGSLLGLSAMGIKFDEVARIATTLGRAMGQDAAKSVDDLTTALSRMSPQILDNLGIKVDLTAATEAYAKSIGKSVEALTEEEKKMAFATAAMEAARTKASQLGEITLTVADQAERIAIAFTDMGVQALAAGNQSVTFAGQLGKVADAIDRIRNAPGASGDTIARTLSQAGKWATSKAEQVENSAPWYLSSLASIGMAPTAIAGYLASSAAPLIGNTSPLTAGMFPPMASHGGAAVGGRAPGGGGAAGGGDTPAKIRKISDAQRELNTQIEKAFKVSKQAGEGWEEYAGNLQLARMEMEQFIATQPDNLIGANHPLSAIMGGPYQYQISGNGNGLKPVIAQTRDLRAEVRGVAQAFGTLAQIAGPSMDNVSRGFGTVVAAADAANQLTTTLSNTFERLWDATGGADGKGGLSKTGKGVAGAMAGLTTGLQLGGLFTNRGAGLAAGAAGGAASGAMAGGPWGALAGGIVGGLSGLYAAGQNKKAQAAQIEQSRQQIISTFGTLADFRRNVERAGYSYDYFLQSFDSNKPEEFTRVVNELNRVLAEQKARADALVTGLGRVAQVQGVLTRQQIAQIRNTRNDDPAAEGINGFLAGQAHQAERGLLAVVAALSTYGDKAVADFGLAADAAAAGLAALFGEALASGESAIDVLGRLGGSMNTLADLFSKSGRTPGAGFSRVQDLAGIVANPQQGAAVQTAQGLGQALASFYNTGVFAAMPDLFGEIANGIGAAWKALENFGAGGQRGAALLQPYLQNLWEMIEANPQLEQQLDDQTRALLEFATANGIVGPAFRDAAEKMQSALERLIAKLDTFIDRMSTAAGLTFPNPNTPSGPAAPADPSAPAYTPNGGDYGYASSTNGLMGVASSAPAGGGITQIIDVQLGRETIARAVAEDLPRIVSVYGGVS